MRRVDTEELLDQHDAPHEDMLRSLTDLRRINRWLGGRIAYRSMVRHLCRELAAHRSVPPRGPMVRHLSTEPAAHRNVPPQGGTEAPLRILDLGTGTSDLLGALGMPHESIGVDFKLEHLIEGRRLDDGRVDRITADAFRIPLRDSSVDVVTSAHFFHHFSPDENVEILTEALRISRIGVAVNDTRRHFAPWMFVSALGALRLVGPITRFDAPASVRRGYTVPEVSDIASRIPASRWAIRRIFPFRWILLLWK